MKDLFATPINGYHHLKPLEDPFRWVVAIFSADGAVQAIIKANKVGLKTYFPIRMNGKGEPIPLWRNYLFIQFVEYVTIDLVRDTPNFIRVISAHDDEGMLRPVLVRRSAIDEHRAMILAGKFNERSINRQFHGRGSLVRVIEGTFIDKKVRLEEDVYPDWKGNHRVKVDIDGIKGTVELYKLSL
jgi:hypothetical protein